MILLDYPGCLRDYAAGWVRGAAGWQEWLFRGELKDPYKEFMVAEDSSVSRDAQASVINAQFWESRK